MATIKDVAKLAGVSVATVSRAMNNSGYVSQEANEKIQEAIRILNYTPNEVARSLYQKKSRFIGLLLPDISNPFFPLVAKGVEDYSHQEGYHVILGNVQENPERSEEYFRMFDQNNVSGVLSAVSDHQKQVINTPFVMLDRVNEEAEYAVYSDDKLGGQIAAKAILVGKPRKVVVVAGPSNVARSYERLLSVENTLNKHQQDYSVLQTKSFQFEDAEQTAVELFQKYQDVDSIIAPSDTHGITLLQEALRRGYSVPKDIQIIGYDDIPISQLTFPRLSTIHQPAYQIGWKGAELLIQLIRGKTIREKKVKLPVHLENRDTLRR